MTDQRTPAAAADAGAAPEAAPARPDAADTAAPEIDWRGGLPDRLRRVAEKFPTPADAVKSYAELERRLGRSVTLPDADAGAVEIDAFHARLGRPETPDGYEIRLPDGVPDHLKPGAADDAARTAFLAAMHGAGAPPETVQAAFDWYYAAAIEADAASRRAEKQAAAESEAALRREWGEAYDRNTALARRALVHFGGDALAASADQAGIARDPAWLRALSRIGQATLEDGLLTGGETAPATDARARIDTIMAEHFGKPGYNAAGVQDELRTLYGTLYGEGEE